MCSTSHWKTVYELKGCSYVNIIYGFICDTAYDHIRSAYLSRCSHVIIIYQIIYDTVYDHIRSDHMWCTICVIIYGMITCDDHMCDHIHRTSQ